MGQIKINKAQTKLKPSAIQKIKEFLKPKTTKKLWTR